MSRGTTKPDSTDRVQVNVRLRRDQKRRLDLESVLRAKPREIVMEEVFDAYFASRPVAIDLMPTS